MGREDEIRLIAYSIWEEEGYPHGNDFEHWIRAEAAWQERYREPLSQKIEDIEAKPGPTFEKDLEKKKSNKKSQGISAHKAKR